VVPDIAEEAHAGDTDSVVPTRGCDSVPMVGLGGSAGSISALQSFFKTMPADSGMAFVVILHLSPNHESTLAEVLQHSTRMPVVQVNENEEVQPNRVYVIPPGKALSSLDGRLSVSKLTTERGRRVAVDLFFRTLADTHGPRAAAIVLSGADGDGSIGIKRIKERGGLTIAQDPDEAQHREMPSTAIATGMVDWILPVGQMPARLTAYRQLDGNLKLPPEELPADAPPESDRQESELREVLAFLRTRTGRDFSFYKRATVLRRIGRRMQVNGVADLPAYLAHLRTHNGEAEALLQDMLISVTNFFRDADAFAALEGHIPALFKGKTGADTVRVWVPACATGEEAYSIGMLLCEYARRLSGPPRIQIFATDLDEDAIRTAREGLYPATIAADVSEDRLKRFFKREHRGYRVRREVRECVLFAVHDVLRDSPFSRLDLVSCRNLLIYLNREAQQRLFSAMHFALRHQGLLFLGVSETVDEESGLFTPLDKKNRIYMQRPSLRPGWPVPVGASALARVLETAVQELPEHRAASDWQPAPSVSWGALHGRLIERLAPPSVLINAEHEMLHLSDNAGRFLQFAGGAPTNNLLQAVHPMLRIELRAALYRSSQTRAAAVAHRVPVEIEGRRFTVDLHVSPAQEVASDVYLVVFENVQAAPAEAPTVQRSDEDDAARQLEREVERLKAHLRDTVQQYEGSTEELKASNEELQAMNEELRSATEELETGREELQSINEELTTVNVELKNKVDELAHANSDLNNLMSATAIATVFLDRDLKIMRYTPSAAPLFNLIPADVGRPLSDLASRVEYPQMLTDAQNAIEQLEQAQREVRAGDRWFLARVLPYRTMDDRIGGVVFTFLDITARKHAENALRESEEEFRAMVSQASAGVVHTDLERRITMANRRFGEFTGYTEAELAQRRFEDLLHPDDRERHRALFEQLTTAGTSFETEARLQRRDGGEVWIKASVALLRDSANQPRSVVAFMLDVTAEAAAREALEQTDNRLRLIIENAREYAIVSTDLERRVTSWNSGAERLLGYTENEILHRSADIIFTPEDRAAGAPELEARTALTEGRAADERWHLRKDGSRFWGSGVMMAMHNRRGDVVGLVKIFRDETDVRSATEAIEKSRGELWMALEENRKAREDLEAASRAKDHFLAVLSHELRTPLTPVLVAAQTLSMRKDLPEAAQAAVEMIKRNVRIEAHFIDDLLDLTRISRGQLQVIREPMDMHEAIRGAIEICNSEINDKGQQLKVLLNAPRRRIEGDFRRLQQVVWNVVKNASKFSPPGADIVVASSNEGDRFRLVVADTGIGIEPDKLSTVFDAFTQGHEHIAREFGGLGLGLAISKATIDAHEGTMVAESAGVGQGTTVTITLPLP
jgi:two-component system, chemotaxis family, CheB/CheR fusion protein